MILNRTIGSETGVFSFLLFSFRYFGEERDLLYCFFSVFLLNITYLLDQNFCTGVNNTEDIHNYLFQVSLALLSRTKKSRTVALPFQCQLKKLWKRQFPPRRTTKKCFLFEVFQDFVVMAYRYNLLVGMNKISYRPTNGNRAYLLSQGSSDVQESNYESFTILHIIRTNSCIATSLGDKHQENALSYYAGLKVRRFHGSNQFR